MDQHLFSFEGLDVQVLVKQNEPWFVGYQVASLLGYSNTRDALSKHVDDEDKQILTSQNATLENIPNRGLVIINESGLYSLILKSRLPEAKQFKRWVTAEVLPTIRKHGAYMTPQTIEQAITSPDFLIRLATNLKEEQQKRLAAEQKVIEQQPKVLFADSVAASKTSILIGELAKILKQNGIEIGQKRLFEWLRENGFLIKRKGSDYNTPTQKAMELELFEIKETVVNHSDGHTSINKTSKVTGKGQIYFINKFLKEGEINA